MNEQTDATLIERCRQHDPEAWNALVARHHEYVYRVALSYLRNGESARDVTQEVCVALVRFLDGFRGGASFRTFLHRIVHNTALSHVAREKLRTHDPLPAVDPATPDRVEAELVATQRQRVVLTALQEIDEEFRAVLTARYTGGLSEKETAESLGLPIGTVKSRHARGLMRMRKVLSENGHDV